MRRRRGERGGRSGGVTDALGRGKGAPPGHAPAVVTLHCMTRAAARGAAVAPTRAAEAVAACLAALPSPANTTDACGVGKNSMACAHHLVSLFWRALSLRRKTRSAWELRAHYACMLPCCALPSACIAFSVETTQNGRQAGVRR